MTIAGSVFVKLRRFLLGRRLTLAAERNESAADRLDAAVREVLRR